LKNTTLFLCVLGALCGGALSTSLTASSPKLFQAATQADFLKGDVENLSIDARGQLVLGPALELVYETPAPFIWTIASTPDGTFFLGTGNDGKVYRVGPDGKGALFFSSAELEVHALAPAPNGGLYVATSPDGKIYRVDRDGRATTFFTPEDKYIWALAVDAKGNVFAGTGEKGIVYRIAPDGKGTPFYRTKTTHATALSFDRSGNLIVGTGSPGKVIRVDQDGKGFVLLDTTFQEIRGLHFDDKGMLFVTAMNGRTGASSGPIVPPVVDQPAGGRALVPNVTVSTEITSIVIADTPEPSTASSSRDARSSTKGAVYRIAPDGLWDQVWDSREDVPYDVTFDAAGAPIIATGNKGKLYRLEGDPLRPTLLTRAGAQQVTTFIRSARGQMFFATANPGKLFRVSSERAQRGVYESEARDAQMLATWGSLRWRGSIPRDGRIELSTRSGNTETPDETWSPWSPAYSSPEGSPIASPKARYLQWRAVLTGKGEGPVLTSVAAAYLQRNLRPVVRSITVHPPGIVFQKPFTTGEPELAGFADQTTPDRKLTNAAQTPQGSSSPGLGRRTYQKNLQTFVWRADDENDDDLVYDVLYRREGETEWTPLRRGVDEPIFVWDTTTVPNGTYFVRIVASDAPSNPSETALIGERDSGAFQIDHTPPAVNLGGVRVNGGKTTVSFTVTDADSPVSRVEYSRDGGLKWTAIFPVDGIADSKTERYELTLDGPLDENGVTIRASDSMNNADTRHVSR
jgi:sugar lactone lactonase YvrE